MSNKELIKDYEKQIHLLNRQLLGVLDYVGVTLYQCEGCDEVVDDIPTNGEGASICYLCRSMESFREVE